jgi:hypothetical protein
MNSIGKPPLYCPKSDDTIYGRAFGSNGVTYRFTDLLNSVPVLAISLVGDLSMILDIREAYVDFCTCNSF